MAFIGEGHKSWVILDRHLNVVKVGFPTEGEALRKAGQIVRGDEAKVYVAEVSHKVQLANPVPPVVATKLV
jgi:hypothetical protein